MWGKREGDAEGNCHGCDRRFRAGLPPAGRIATARPVRSDGRGKDRTRPSLIHFRLQQSPALQAPDCGIDAMAEGGVDAGGGEFGEHLRIVQLLCGRLLI